MEEKPKIRIYTLYEAGFVRLEGQTYPVKEIIKKYGGIWHPYNAIGLGVSGCWWLPAENLKALYDELAGKVEFVGFGSSLDWEIWERKTKKEVREK